MSDNMDNQHFYYETLSGKLLGSVAREHKILAELNKLKKTESFLDVGCAQGFYLSLALEKTKKCFGIDVPPHFITQAKKTGATCVVGSAEKMPYKNNSFDVVLCTEVLEHVPNWKKAVKEIKRVLKKNGRAIITVPLEKKSLFWRTFSIPFPPEPTRGHLHLLEARDITKEFAPMKQEKKVYVQSASERLNKILPQNEKLSMYCFFVFRK